MSSTGGSSEEQIINRNADSTVQAHEVSDEMRTLLRIGLETLYVTLICYICYGKELVSILFTS
jgi:hypothetical protein